MRGKSHQSGGSPTQQLIGRRNSRNLHQTNPSPTSLFQHEFLKLLFQRTEHQPPRMGVFSKQSHFLFHNRNTFHALLTNNLEEPSCRCQRAFPRCVVTQTPHEGMARGEVLCKVGCKDSRERTQLPQFTSQFSYLMAL